MRGRDVRDGDGDGNHARRHRPRKTDCRTLGSSRRNEQGSRFSARDRPAIASGSDVERLAQYEASTLEAVTVMGKIATNSIAT